MESCSIVPITRDLDGARYTISPQGGVLSDGRQTYVLRDGELFEVRQLEDVSVRCASQLLAFLVELSLVHHPEQCELVSRADREWFREGDGQVTIRERAFAQIVREAHLTSTPGATQAA